MFFRPGGLRFAGGSTTYYRDGRGGAPDSGHLALIISFECEWGVIKVANTHLRWGQEEKSPEEHIGLMEIDGLTPLPSAGEPSDHPAIVAAFEKG